MPTESATPPEPAWQFSAFNELAPADLYAAMQLRQRVFVVEQSCAYMDADGSDQRADHLLGWINDGGDRRLIAYARIFPPRVKYAEASIGRVATHPDVRQTGAGKALMREAIERLENAGYGSEIRIAAQLYLERFYASFGFVRVS
ncbi:MAG TPA: GNAT family N-acetyltransferase, partial [Gemmatimonadaceae bacterium]|nr:GNAT family N-acetyltransferase [Gemmatimonadaceae bacterium]